MEQVEYLPSGVQEEDGVLVGVARSPGDQAGSTPLQTSTMEQLSAPSADPENQARARSSLGSNSKKEAWLEAAGGTRYAS